MGNPKNIAVRCLIFSFLLATSVVLTYGDGTVRLVNNFDSDTHKGRVEIFYGNSWGTICDDEWDILDADVVCRQLGYTGALRALSRAYFGYGSSVDPIWLDNVGCTGNEERIQDCPSSGWGNHNCVHMEDASVECSTATVRMVGGPDRLEGNVQVQFNHANVTTWGYVCDDQWDERDADVACFQLDQRQSYDVQENSFYGSEDGPLVLNNLDCIGSEYTLQECPSGGIGNCTRFDKAGVTCLRDFYEDGAVRLAGTAYSNRGRVEIYHNGEWGTVCDDYWDYYDAKVVCRQLGYVNSQAKAYYNSYFGAGQGRIWLDNMACGGGEARLENCVSSNGWGVHDCSHGEDAGVYCDERGEFDAAEITGIVLASLFGASILFCCVKYICCEAASNKRHQRRRRSRMRHQNGRSPAAATRSTDPEDHFNAHFNNAYTISDNQEEIFTPPGFLCPPPFPGSAPPPLSPTDLPPAYETIMANSVPHVPDSDGTSATNGGTATGRPNQTDVNMVPKNPTSQTPALPPSTTLENALPVSQSTLAYPPEAVNAVPDQLPPSNMAYPPEPVNAIPTTNMTNIAYPPAPLVSQQQAAAPLNPPSALPPIETVMPPSARAVTNQVDEKKKPLPSSLSCQPTFPVPNDSEVQHPPAHPITVAESPAANPATDDANHHEEPNHNPNTSEEPSVTFVASAEGESVYTGLSNDESDRLSEA